MGTVGTFCTSEQGGRMRETKEWWAAGPLGTCIQLDGTASIGMIAAIPSHAFVTRNLLFLSHLLNSVITGPEESSLSKYS